MRRARPRAAKARSLRPDQKRVLPRLEILEDRTLLAVTLTGVPSYEPQGPAPIVGGQSDVPGHAAAGAINAILQSGTSLFVGTVNGGVWRTDDPDAASPHWIPLTDQYPGLSIDSLASGAGAIYAGIGDSSSYSSDGGALTGVLRSTDNGNTWQQLATQPPAVAPTVNVVISLAGALQVGTYYLKYTYTNAGGESPPSLESSQFTVPSLGYVPQVTVPPLPEGVTGIKVYLTQTDGASGSEQFSYPFSSISTTPTLPPPLVNSTNPFVAPPAAPQVDPIGGGLTGGGLPAGNYFVQYTWNGPTTAPGETLPSSEAEFRVQAGQIPLLTLSTFPANAATAKIYLTPTNGAAGSEFLYASGVQSQTYFLRQPLPTVYDLISANPRGLPKTNLTSPVTFDPTVAATFDATGGGATGGNLPAGSYYVAYTWADVDGHETKAKEAGPFLVGAGNIPQVTLPSLPPDIFSSDIYLTNAASGSEVIYEKNVPEVSGKTVVDLSAPLLSVMPPAQNTLAWAGPGPAPEPDLGGLSALNVVKILPTGLSNSSYLTLDQQIVLAATSGGLFLSGDGGVSWSNESARAGSGLPAGAAVSDLILDSSQIGNGDILYAAIPGGGVYRAVLRKEARYSSMGILTRLSPARPSCHSPGPPTTPRSRSSRRRRRTTRPRGANRGPGDCSDGQSLRRWRDRRDAPGRHVPRQVQLDGP